MKAPVLAVAVALVAAGSFTLGAPQSFAPEAAPGELKAAVAAADAALAALRQRLTARLLEEMKQGGPARAVAVCRDEAPVLSAEVGRAAGVVVGRTSDRLRNPANRAPAWAEAVVRAAAGRRAADVAPVAFALGDKVGVLRPIAMGGPCARCHGTASELDPAAATAIRAAYPQDAATGFEAGDLRGFAWAEAPVEIARPSSTPSPQK
jgi:hypothetical protein